MSIKDSRKEEENGTRENDRLLQRYHMGKAFPCSVAASKNAANEYIYVVLGRRRK